VLPLVAMMRIFCDFDGTITNRDSIVFLTEYFGAGVPFREEVLRAIKSGELSVFEAIRREMETVRVGWEEAARALKANIHVHPTFPAFVRWARKSGIDLTVVSSGMEPVLDLLIGEFGIPYFAHQVTPLESGWVYERVPAHDKEVILRQARREGPLVFIGDGTSDLSAIPYAEILFARKDYYLSRYCRERSIPHLTFNSFTDIRDHLEKYTAENCTASG